jgi:hypothetical protein
MAELARPGDAAERRSRTGEILASDSVVALRARVAELEALLDARTQAIVGLGARLAQFEAGAPAPLDANVEQLQSELAQLRATKLWRYSAVPRRIYARTRRIARG